MDKVVGEGKVVKEAVRESIVPTEDKERLENQISKIMNMDETIEKELRKKVESMRVDFSSIETISQYGSSVMIEIAEILNNVSIDHSMEVGDMREFQKAINEVLGYGNTLDKEAEKSSQLMVRSEQGVKKLLKKVFKMDIETEIKIQFDEVLEKQNKKIDYLGERNEEMIQVAQNGAQMNQEYLRQMQPLVELFHVLIMVGYEDLEEHKFILKELERRGADDFIVQNYKIKVNTFIDTLLGLKKAEANYEIVMTEINNGIYNKIQIVSNCNLTRYQGLPQLKAMAVVLTSQTVDKLQIKEQKAFSDALNTAIVQSAKLTYDNTKEVSKLNEEGLVHVDTLVTASKYLEDSSKLIDQIMSSDKNIKKQLSSLDKVAKSLEVSCNRIKASYTMIDDDTNLIEQQEKILVKSIMNDQKNNNKR